MHQTRPAELLAPFVVAGGVTYVYVRSHYGSLPALDYIMPIPFVALAIVEFALARRIRAAISHDPDVKVVPAIFVIRCVALGKASSIVGALMTGVAGGLLAWVLPRVGDLATAGHDATVAALLAAACLVLLAAGLVLERSGIDPGQPGEPHADRAS